MAPLSIQLLHATSPLGASTTIAALLVVVECQEIDRAIVNAALASSPPINSG